MANDKTAVANDMRERQEGTSELPPGRDLSRYPNEGRTRAILGTVLFYVALPALLLGVITPLYSSFHWLKTGEWKNVTLIDVTPALGGWRPSWVMFDYVLTQAHVALPASVFAVILFFACALLFSD